jgi:hypothetical protein
MAIYDFKCGKCETIKRDIVLPITHRSGERPVCCDELMGYHISSVPMVVWKDPNIEPFRFRAVKGAPVVTTTKQRREIMEREGLVDANDLIVPPSQQEQMAEHAEAMESVNAITPDAEQSQRLQEMGLDSPDN